MQNTDQSGTGQPTPAVPAPATSASATPAGPPPPKKGGIGKRIPPQLQNGGKGFPTHPTHTNQNSKFKPVRSNAVRFIQARRAPGA